jgi:hypothetical protein
MKQAVVSKSPKNSAYDRLAVSALKALSGIPKLTVREILPAPRHASSGLDFGVILGFGQKKFKIAAEIKSSGEPSVLRRAAAWLKDLLTKTQYDYGVIVAPFISGEGAAICRDIGVGFLDLSGNCLLSLDGLYVERTGFSNKFKKPREIQSLFSPKSSRVIRCLLSDPKRAWTLKGLSTETGVSIGLIHRLATALEDNFFAEKKLGAFKLEDPARMLEAWREEYQRRAPRWARYVLHAMSVEESVTELAAAAVRHGVRYALSGPCGAFSVSSYLNPTLVHCYVDVLKQEFLDELKADPVRSDGNLLVRVVEKESEFIGSRNVNGAYVVSDLQLYLDLWSMGGRGQDAAEELRRNRLHF